MPMIIVPTVELISGKILKEFVKVQALEMWEIIIKMLKIKALRSSNLRLYSPEIMIYLIYMHFSLVRK